MYYILKPKSLDKERSALSVKKVTNHCFPKQFKQYNQEEAIKLRGGKNHGNIKM